MPSSNHMGSDQSRKAWFERMLPFIPYSGEDDDTWITGRALEAAAGVTEHQRSAGINWGRLHYTLDKMWALVSGRRGYRFVQTARQAASFVNPRAKSVSTLLRGSYFGAQRPIVNRLIADGQMSERERQMIDLTVSRALEDIERLRTVI